MQVRGDAEGASPELNNEGDSPAGKAMSDETKVDPPKKTPSRMLVELLQSPEIDHMKNMVIVYEDDKGTAVVGGHRDRFEVIGMLQFGIMIVYEGSRKKGSYEQE